MSKNKRQSKVMLSDELDKKLTKPSKTYRQKIKQILDEAEYEEVDLLIEALEKNVN